MVQAINPSKSCGPKPKSLKGQCCTDKVGNTCFCGDGKCGCVKKFGPGPCYDAHVAWCGLADPTGKYSSFCAEEAGAPANLVQRGVLTATLPGNKDKICAKNCGFLDAFCTSAKAQAGCGGTDQTMTYVALIGIGVVALIILLR